MKRSDEIAELATALAKAQGQMEDAAKAAENPHFRSRYADLASVHEAIRKPLSDNGLCWVQAVETVEDGVAVETTLFHTSGQWLSSLLRVPTARFDAQGVGSATSYARRYGLMALVGVAGTDDEDGNAATGKNGSAKKTDEFLTPANLEELKKMIEDHDLEPSRILRSVSASSLETIRERDFPRLMAMLRTYVAKHPKPPTSENEAVQQYRAKQQAAASDHEAASDHDEETQ